MNLNGDDIANPIRPAWRATQYLFEALWKLEILPIHQLPALHRLIDHAVRVTNSEF